MLIKTNQLGNHFKMWKYGITKNTEINRVSGQEINVTHPVYDENAIYV